MSQVDSLHKSMGDKIDFYILSNEDLKKQKSFLATKNWDLPFYRYTDSIFTELNVKVLPTLILEKIDICTFSKLVLNMTGIHKKRMNIWKR